MGTATGTFAGVGPTAVNKTVTVSDTLGGATTSPGTATATDSTPFTVKVFNYTRTLAPPDSGCTTQTNTAKLVETGQTATASVKTCNTGALSMGYWRNKNGQAIISAANQSNLGSWLRQFHPFSDAPSSGLAAYVAKIIGAAMCSGNACNAMLRAQMLATALDVYFGDASLGGNQLNAPLPIGAVTIDLTKICASPNGASCPGASENAGSAFGGATSLTVLGMLTYENTADPKADAGAAGTGMRRQCKSCKGCVQRDQQPGGALTVGSRRRAAFRRRVAVRREIPSCAAASCTVDPRARIAKSAT